MSDSGHPFASIVRYVVASARVEIEIADVDALERVIGPQGDEWRSRFYALHTTEDVLEHWAFNALANGVTDIRRLDGWADLAEDAVRIEIDRVSFDFEHFEDDLKAAP